MVSERTFNVFADYFQFLVRDARADWEDLADRWTTEALEDMFIQGEGYVAIGTARNMPVPVTIRTASQEPAMNPDEWDRVVHGKLATPSGELVVTGVTDNETSGGRIKVTPGDHHVRVLYGGIHTVSDDGLSGEDRYTVEIWPASAASPPPSAPEFVKK